MLLTIMSLKDKDMDVALQEMALLEWIKKNGDEPTTFQLINMLDTFEQRGTTIDPMVRVIIKNVNDRMEPEMLKALAFWLVNERQQYLGLVLRKFAELKDRIDLEGVCFYAGAGSSFGTNGVLATGRGEEGFIGA